MCLDIPTLTELIDNEIIQATGLKADSWLGRHLHPLIDKATRHFSELFSECDHIISCQGVAAGARWLLLNMVKDYKSRGAEQIPQNGPLVIASNHPGSVDSLSLIASAKRDDLKVIAGDIPFLQNLPNVSRHLIFTSYEDPYSRMVAIRKAIQPLESGGTILLFAQAGIDPDPSFMANADEGISHWSRSLEVFLHSVPQVQVLVSVVSHVIDPLYMRHPVTWLRRARPDRQRLAMMIQIIEQMLGKKLDLIPRVSFSPVLDLRRRGGPDHAMQTITDSARLLMKSHLEWQV